MCGLIKSFVMKNVYSRDGLLCNNAQGIVNIMVHAAVDHFGVLHLTVSSDRVVVSKLILHFLGLRVKSG